MTKLPIKYVIIEGPDCSGKTSLCSALNKEVGFVRNIRDRSYLSTLCYARLYDRPVVDDLRTQLNEELCDANNFIVVMLPDKDVILSRLQHRGDEYQDCNSIVKLYDIFSEEVEKIENLPNVLVVRNSDTLDRLALQISNTLSTYESQSLNELGSSMHQWTKLSVYDEVQLKLRLDVSTDHKDLEILEDPHETHYYKEILNSCSLIIEKEKLGKNPYRTKQGLDSRRFYYSSDTCISSIHFLNRAATMKVICTLRSTDSIKNGSIDLRFLASLCTLIRDRHSWNPGKIQLDVNYNSLHVRRDKV